MKKVAFLIVSLSASVFNFAYADTATTELYIERSTFKKSGLRRILPHLFVVDASGKPIYYQQGGSNVEFSKLIVTRERAEDDDETQSSWQKLMALPEVANHVKKSTTTQQIYLVSASQDYFDCTACTMQKESLEQYVQNSDVEVVHLYIK